MVYLWIDAQPSLWGRTFQTEGAIGTETYRLLLGMENFVPGVQERVEGVSMEKVFI